MTTLHIGVDSGNKIDFTGWCDPSLPEVGRVHIHPNVRSHDLTIQDERLDQCVEVPVVLRLYSLNLARPTLHLMNVLAELITVCLSIPHRSRSSRPR